MWGIVRQFLKMGTLTLQKHAPYHSDMMTPFAEIGQNGQPDTQRSETHRRAQATPKMTGFAARREQLMDSSVSE